MTLKVCPPQENHRAIHLPIVPCQKRAFQSTYIPADATTSHKEFLTYLLKRGSFIVTECNLFSFSYRQDKSWQIDGYV